MKRVLSIILMLTLLAGVSAMGQTRVRQKPAAKSESSTERIAQKSIQKSQSNKVKDADAQKIAEPRALKDTITVNWDDVSYGAPMEQVVGEHHPDGPKPRIDGEVVYSEVEQMPRFPGGLDGLMEYLNSNIVYPRVAAEKNVQGSVLVQFVVEKDGSVGEIKILRSVEVNLDYEAIRLCKSMPKFEPGMVDGQPVRVWYTLPISFKLED